MSIPQRQYEIMAMSGAKVSAGDRLITAQPDGAQGLIFDLISEALHLIPHFRFIFISIQRFFVALSNRGETA